MENDCGRGMRNWAYYEQPLQGNLGLQLMSSVAADRETTKPLLSNSRFLHGYCSLPDPSIPMKFMQNGWMNHRDNKIFHMMPMNTGYSVIPDNHATHALNMIQQPAPVLKDDKQLVSQNELGWVKETPLKKRSQGQARLKAPKPKKTKKAAAARNETKSCSGGRARNQIKNTDIVINGVDLNISGISTPVCTCTGTPQQCYRWGVGGWQSACCTTNISMYPLPIDTKRQGARIAGRKMSQGAFKKVLEKLAGEGYNLSYPIDLKTYWAKHGTNKFVTIRESNGCHLSGNGLLSEIQIHFIAHLALRVWGRFDMPHVLHWCGLE